MQDRLSSKLSSPRSLRPQVLWLSLSAWTICIAALSLAQPPQPARPQKPPVRPPIPPNSAPPLTGRDALGDWHSDAPGVRRRITLADLPAPGASHPNKSKLVAMPAGASPKVPLGFKVDLVVTGLAQPRVLRVSPNGDLFVANSKANEVRVYRIAAGEFKPTQSEVFASGLNKPYGIAFYPPGPEPKWIYIANTDGVVRFPYVSGDLKAPTSQAESIVSGLPSTHHWTRDITFSRDGKQMFLAVGSGSNIAQDMFPEPHEDGGLPAWIQSRPLGAAWDTEERRAVILSLDPAGGETNIYSAGIRNPAGIAIQPATGDLWAVVNERDGLGDNTPFEYAARISKGSFFGWPWYYMGSNQDPRHKGARPDLSDKLALPDVLLPAHSAPLQIVFYNGQDFPPEYTGDAFVTFHGSWDRATRTGYKVVRLRFDREGKPTGEFEDFMTGFVASDQEVWGRPVGLAVGDDGSLFVSEDGNGSIWRVSRDRSEALKTNP